MNEAGRRIIAVSLGLGLFSTVIAVGSLFSGSSLYPFLFLVLSHAITAGVLGYIWPHIGWRIGLWMFLVWPVILIVGFSLTADYIVSAQEKWKDILVALLFCFAMMPVGCSGGWIGALIARYKRHSPIKSSPA
jgi:hypothetical protein